MTLNSVTYGDVTIAGQQAQPPAGHDDIAFRPACTQVASILLANGRVEHSINLPDGKTRVLAAYDNMPIDKARLYLDADGLCKAGPDAIDVPIVYSSQLPQQALATGTAAPSNPDVVAPESVQNAGSGMGGMLMGAIALAAVGTIFCLWSNRSPSPKNDSPNQDPKPSPSGRAEIDKLTKW